MKLKQTDGDVKSDTKMKTGAILTKKTKQNDEHFQRGPLELRLELPSSCPQAAAPLELPSNCRSHCGRTSRTAARTVLDLPLNCRWNCARTAARTVLELPLNCRSICARTAARTVPELPLNCRSNCARPVLENSRSNSFELPLELSSNCHQTTA